MRYAKPLLVVAVLAWVTQQYGSNVRHTVVQWRAELAARNFEDNTTRSAGYVIPTDRWLEYEVAPNAQQIRVLTNASLQSLPADDRQPDYQRPGWRYSVAYQLVDTRGEVVQESVYNFRATVNRFSHPSTGEIYSPYFYANSSDIPTNTRTLQCPLKPLNASIARIRLKLASHDTLISEVVCRVLNRVDRPDYTDPTIWGRLSEQRRMSLCRASVYGPELLTPAERRSILRWQWSIAPPIIGAGSRATQRILYRIDEPTGEEIGAMTTPAGMSVDESNDGTVSLPSVPGMAKIEIERADLTYPRRLSSECEVKIIRHFQGILEPETKTLLVGDEVFSQEITVEGGMLEFHSNEHVVIRVTWQDVDRLAPPRSLHEESSSLRMYRLAPQGVRYRISHLDSQPTPLRADFRTMAETLKGPVTITWGYFDKHGKATKSDDITIQPIPSRFDSTTIRSTKYTVSNPESFFWSVPPDVAEFRLESQTDVLVGAFTRPPDVVRVVQSDSENGKPTSEFGSLDRSWFVIRPNHHNALQTSNRTTVVNARPRPPVHNTLIASGDYEWVSYRPQGLWRARRLLTPRDQRNPVREQAEDVVFRKYDIGMRYNVRIDNLQSPPTIIYDNEKVGTTISVFLNEEKICEHRCRSLRGEFPIAGCSSNMTASLEVRSDESRPIYINHLRADECDTFQKRMAFRLLNSKLEFNYRKQSAGEEVLSLRVFRSDSHLAPTRIQIDLPDLKFHSSALRRAWTWKSKQYELPSSDSDVSLLLDGATTRANEGDLAFIRLGEDVPVGVYRIRVSRLDGGHGYVVLYQTLPHANELREVQLIQRDYREEIQ